MWLRWNYFAGNKNFFRLLKRHEDVKYCYYSDLMSIWFHCDTGKIKQEAVSLSLSRFWSKSFSIFSFILTNFIIFVLLNLLKLLMKSICIVQSLCHFLFLTRCADASCQACPAQLTQGCVGCVWQLRSPELPQLMLSSTTLHTAGFQTVPLQKKYLSLCTSLLTTC